MSVSQPQYKVRVSKDHLVFSSGHFITFDGDHCERIHGHNYRVAVEIEDDLDENHYVFDFIALLDMTKAITMAWDHRMLLPTRSSLIRLEDDGPNNVKALYRDRYWSFPREECVLLPIPNTTTEWLARLVAERLLETIAKRMMKPPRVLSVEVEENFGQSAFVRIMTSARADG